MLDIEFHIAMSMTLLSPTEVVECVAGWEKWENLDVPAVYVRTGFVVRLRDGRYAYLTTHRIPGKEYQAATSQKFDTEPTYLYDRAVNWVFDREKLNARTKVSKQKANYPDDGIPHYSPTG